MTQLISLLQQNPDLQLAPLLLVVMLMVTAGWLFVMLTVHLMFEHKAQFLNGGKMPSGPVETGVVLGSVALEVAGLVAAGVILTIVPLWSELPREHFQGLALATVGAAGVPFGAVLLYVTGRYCWRTLRLSRSRSIAKAC